MSKRQEFKAAAETEVGGFNVTGYAGSETEVDLSNACSPTQVEEQVPAVDEEKTEVVGTLNDIQPVVGWLVCLDGPSKGMSFNLHNGWNYIGRDENLDVYIPDPKVSRARTARIVYEPEGRTFAVAICEGAQTLVYVNKKPLYNASELNAYDKIRMGDTTLTFIPLCGEKFSWEG